jgi:hypothetical protein
MVLISGTSALQARKRNQAWEAHSTASRHDRWQREGLRSKPKPFCFARRVAMSTANLFIEFFLFMPKSQTQRETSW